ncbi:MAG: hypothetical protein BWY67_02284 [Bacteroidetes bacterium ADurb.Bin397]|nr:MAG: hypothetical protein BWY67_02284 [Bacteroidetes bacterium ADurb.Bin397]
MEIISAATHRKGTYKLSKLYFALAIAAAIPSMRAKSVRAELTTLVGKCVRMTESSENLRETHDAPGSFRL